MVFWLLTNAEGCLISGNNKITLKLNKRSNSESLVRNRGEKKLERRVSANLLKAALKNKKLYCKEKQQST